MRALINILFLNLVICEIYHVGQGAKNIEFLVISHSLRTMPVPNLVPEFKII